MGEGRRQLEEISELIWNEKYRYNNESFEEMYKRIASHAYSLDPDKSIHEDKAYNALISGDFIPGGRIHAGAGTGRSVTLINCFGKDTEILTEKGFQKLGELGGNINIVSPQSGKLEKATAKSYGQQPLNEIHISTSSKASDQVFKVLATPNHRWILKDGSETTELQIGNTLAPATGHKVDTDPMGWIHGFYYGDGTHDSHNEKYYVARLCGDKAEYADFIARYGTEAQVKRPPSANGDPIVRIRSDYDLKKVPPAGVSVEYITGFVKGVLAADGCLKKYKDQDRPMQFHTVEKDTVLYLRDYLVLAGYAPSGDITANTEPSNYGKRLPLYELIFRPLKSHPGFKVVDIKQGANEEVFCVEEPKYKQLILRSGIRSGNCFVANTIEDSIEGIMDVLKESVVTLKYGGGIGIDFTPIRPKGAALIRTGSDASGPVSYMHVWDAGCQTVKSAGNRRGAMMATLGIGHPDVLEFIEAKHTKGHLTNFNVSVLVTDDFMQCKSTDGIWDLGFHIPPLDSSKIKGIKEKDGQPWYVYEQMPARKLWDQILYSTYEYAEPGIIFIDRVNNRNNLQYCETINCSNPCAEQFLPPRGDCCLGHINVVNMVTNPFTPDAKFDFSKLENTAAIAVRFLDNILDISKFPIKEQYQEAQNKRRIGVGFTGLATALQMLQLDYRSEQALHLARKIGETLRDSIYLESVHLAVQRGAFPLCNKERYLETSFVQKLPDFIKYGIQKYGIRNGVLMSIAPTGTVSILNGNISSGIEPTFSWAYDRKIRLSDGSFKTIRAKDYGYKLYRQMNPTGPLPSYMVTTEDLSVNDHLNMLGAMQEYVDSSISKTINIPQNMPFEEFEHVYDRAYDMGIKCCATYRPSEVRGAVLTSKKICSSCGEAALVSMDGCFNCENCGVSGCSL